MATEYSADEGQVDARQRIDAPPEDSEGVLGRNTGLVDHGECQADGEHHEERGHVAQREAGLPRHARNRGDGHEVQHEAGEERVDVQRQADGGAQERRVHQGEPQRHEVEAEDEDPGEREKASGEHQGNEPAEDRRVGECLDDVHFVRSGEGARLHVLDLPFRLGEHLRVVGDHDHGERAAAR